MTDPAGNRPSTADHPPDTQRPRTPPPFAPIFTLVNNASTRTTHHPHVRYIFSDDDPEVLTQALAECEHSYADDSGSGSVPTNRAMILDLATNDDGVYNVSWASSISPSWAVLNAQLSQISPASSDAGQGSGNGTGDTGTDNTSRPDRLMLRIEGIEMSAPSSPSELRISGETSRQRPGSAGGSGSGHRDRDRSGDGDDYSSMLQDFEKRMSTLRSVVNASEERRKKMATPTENEGDTMAQDTSANDPTPSA